MARMIGQTLLLLAMVFSVAWNANAADRSQLLMAASSCFGFDFDLLPPEATEVSLQQLASPQCELFRQVVTTQSTEQTESTDNPFADQDDHDTCPYESCFVTDHLDTNQPFALTRNQAISQKASLFDLARPFPKKELAQLVSPSAVPFFTGVYQAFTWDGELELDARDSARVFTSTPMPEISLANSPLAASISASWERLNQGLPSRPAPKPEPNIHRQVMDGYWHYYADCDRWNVVFANAAATSECDDMTWLQSHFQLQPRHSVSRILRPMFGNAWIEGVVGNIRGWKSLAVSSVNQISETISEVYAELEFRTIETTVHPLDNELIIPALNRLSTVVRESLDAKNWTDQVTSIAAQIRRLPVIQSARALVEHVARRQMERQKDQLARYLAPRLDWLGDRLSRLADQMDTVQQSRNARRSESSATWK